MGSNKKHKKHKSERREKYEGKIKHARIVLSMKVNKNNY